MGGVGGAVSEFSVEAVAHVAKEKNSSDVMHWLSMDGLHVARLASLWLFMHAQLPLSP